MANVFTISTPSQTLNADANWTATTVFTVTNVTSRPIRGVAKIKPLGSTQGEWLKIDGETERDFPAGGTHQFTVTFSKPKPPTPAPTPPQSFPFRLDAISAINPDEDFTEGQVVTVQVPEQKGEPVKKPFPWLWIIIGAVVLLIIIGVVIWLLSRGGSSGSPTPTPTPTATLPPPPTPRVVRMSARERGVDRPGADFKAFIAQNLDDCENTCKETPDCKAYTYGNPNVCWLKNAQPAPVNNPIYSSGIKLNE